MKGVILCLILVACSTLRGRQAVVTGKLFIFNQPVQLRSQPTASSSMVATLNPHEEALVLGCGFDDGKFDQGHQNWCKIKFGENTGFVPFIANGHKVMRFWQGDYTVLVPQETRVYEEPWENSATITVLARGAVIRVSLGADNWLGVQMKDDKIGYIEADRVIVASAASLKTSEQIEDALARKDEDIKDLQAAAIIKTANPKLFSREPSAYTQILEDDTDESRDFAPKQGDVVWVMASKIVRKTTFYQIFDNGPSNADPMEIYMGAENKLWIAATDVKFCENLYSCTKEMNKLTAPEILDLLAGDGSFDARGVTAKPIKLFKKQHKNVKYFKISRGKKYHIALVAYEQGKYRRLFADRDDTLVDIDGDGNLEVVSVIDRTARSGDPSYAVYGLKGREGLSRILEIRNNRYSVDPPYLVVECQSSYAYGGCPAKESGVEKSDQLIHVFKLANGKFTEVPLPAKYKKRDTELREGKSNY